MKFEDVKRIRENPTAENVDNKELHKLIDIAIEKQIPKKPINTNTRADICPCCNRFIDRHEQKHGNLDIPHCKWCGQALDWSDTDWNMRGSQ